MNGRGACTRPSPDFHARLLPRTVGVRPLGELKIIAAILEQTVIEKILTHLGLLARAPPRAPARGLTLPNRDRSGDPTTRAAGVDCIRGFAGPMEAAW
jgi:hypothetical protein